MNIKVARRIISLVCMTGLAVATGFLAPLSASAITNGFVSSPQNWPSYIGISGALGGYFADEKTCTGSLISRYWVLTAAHCVTDETTTSTSRHTPEGQEVQQSWNAYPPAKLSRVVVGRTDLDDSSQGFDTELLEIRVHPQFKIFGTRDTSTGAFCGFDCRKLQFSDYYNDLALLRLKDPAPRGYSVVTLGTRRPLVGTSLAIYGYGGYEGGNVSRQLRGTKFDSYNVASCSSGRPETECLVGTDLADSRVRGGDSGGPNFAFLDGGLQQVAVSSWGRGDNKDLLASASTVNAIDWIRRTANLPTESGDANSVGMAISIDSSGSMTSNDPSNRRLSAAEAYLTAAGASDAVGIVDFDGSSRIASPARNPRTERDTLVAAIRTIDSSGGTDIGAGVARACEVLQSSGSQGFKAAILLTDGFGSYNNQNSCFKTNGWKLFTFGLGSSVDTALLTRIADETGGRYRSLPTTGDLVCEFQQVRALAAGGTARDCSPTGTVTPGQRIRQIINIGRNLLQAVFSVSWPGSDIDLELTTPSGRIIHTSTDEFDVTAEESPTFETITVATPEPGNWSVDVIGVDVAQAGEPYSLSTVAVPLADLPPVAQITSSPGTEPGAVSFSAAGSTDDNGIVDYIWDFGDGLADSGSDVQHTYQASGTYTVRLTVVDTASVSSATTTSVSIVLNHPPDVSTVAPSKTMLWPPFVQFETVRLAGVTDPDGDSFTLSITGVTQDEKLGLLAPDARVCTDRTKVQLRAERDGFGDGRVYRVAFSADDGKGGVSTGTTTVAVPHILRETAKDSAPPAYDSLALPQGKGMSAILSAILGGRAQRC